MQIPSDIKDFINVIDFHSPYDFILQLQTLYAADLTTAQLKDNNEFIKNLFSIILYGDESTGSESRSTKEDFENMLPQVILNQDKTQVEQTKFPLAGNNNVLMNKQVYIGIQYMFDNDECKIAKMGQLLQNLNLISSKFYDDNEKQYYNQINSQIFNQSESQDNKNITKLQDYDNLNISDKQLGVEQLKIVMIQSFIKLFTKCLICALQFVEHPYQLLLTETFRQDCNCKEIRRDQNNKQIQVDFYKMTEILNVPVDDETLNNCFFILLLKTIADYVEYDDINTPYCTNEIYQLLCLFMSEVGNIQIDLIKYLQLCKVDQNIIDKFEQQSNQYIEQILNRSGVYFNLAYQNVIQKYNRDEYEVQQETIYLLDQFINDGNERKEMLQQMVVEYYNHGDIYDICDIFLNKFNINQETYVNRQIRNSLEQPSILCVFPIFFSKDFKHMVGFQSRYLQSALSYVLSLKKQNKEICQKVFKQHQQRLKDRNIKQLIFNQIQQCSRIRNLDYKDFCTELILQILNKILIFADYSEQQCKLSDEVIQDIRNIVDNFQIIYKSELNDVKIRIDNQLASLIYIYNLLQEIDDENDMKQLKLDYTQIQLFYSGVNTKYSKNIDLIQLQYILTQNGPRQLSVAYLMNKDNHWFANNQKLINNDIPQCEYKKPDRYLTAWIQNEDQQNYDLVDAAKAIKYGQYYKLNTDWIINYEKSKDIIYIIVEDCQYPIYFDTTEIPQIQCDQCDITYEIDNQDKTEEIKITNIVQQYKKMTQEELIKDICQNKGFLPAITYFTKRDQYHQFIKQYIIKGDIDKIKQWQQNKHQERLIFIQDQNKTVGQSLYEQLKFIFQQWDEDTKEQLLKNNKQYVIQALKHFNIHIIYDQEFILDEEDVKLELCDIQD